MVSRGDALARLLRNVKTLPTGYSSSHFASRELARQIERFTTLTSAPPVRGAFGAADQWETVEARSAPRTKTSNDHRDQQARQR